MVKQIQGFENYFIHSQGYVISTKRSKPRRMSMWPDAYGYIRVVLSKNGSTYKKKVHCLIADHFIGDRTGLTVNHKDGNKKNNSVQNLEIITLKENIQHAFALGLSPVKYTRVKCIDTKRIFESIIEAARFYGISKTGISSCVRGIYNKSGKLRWEYA